MKCSNLMISMDYWRGFKEATQPVVFTQLFWTSSGIKLLNSYRGSRVTKLKQIHFTVDKELLIPIDEVCQEITGASLMLLCP